MTSRPLLCTAALASLFLAAAAPGHSQEGRWELVGPFGAEMMSALTAAPSNSRVLYAGTREGKVYRSVNAGASWRDVTGAFPPYRPVDDLEVDPRNPAKAYAIVCDPEYYDKPAVGGLFRTVDAGESWELLDSLDQCQVNDVAIDPRNPAKIVAGTVLGLYQSTNGGTSWRAHAGNPRWSDVTTVKFDPLTPGTVYAIDSEAGFVRSTNGGAAWTVRNSGLPDQQARLIGLTVSTGGPRTLFIQTLSSFDAPLFRSLDGGLTWSPAAKGLGGRTVDDMAAGASPSRFYAATHDGLFISTNQGKSWQAAATPLRFPKLLVVPAGGAVIHAADAQGLLKSTNRGLTWEETNRGLPPLRVDGLNIAPANDNILYASTGMHSLNGGATWSRDGNAAQVLAVHPQFPRVALGSGEGGIWKTRDAAVTWRKLATLECLTIRNIVIDPQTPANLYALGDFRIGCASLPVCGSLKSTDEGVSWSCMNLPQNVSGFGIASSQPSTLYAFGGYPFQQIFKTVNGGISWEVVKDLGQTFGSGLSVSSDDPETLYASMDRVPSRSTDGGVTWSPLAGLPAGPDFSIVLAPSDASVLYAHSDGTSFGRLIYRSTDAGASWAPLSQNGLPSGFFSLLQGLRVSPTDPEVLFAITQGGIYRFEGE